MNKSQSIYKLESLGLNTLDYFISANKGDVLHYLAKHAEDKLSLRTERGTEFQCPFYYMVPGEELVPKAIQHLAEGYTLILAPSLSTEGCKAFGVMAFGDSELDTIEFVMGPGKVRELYNHPDIQTFMVKPGLKVLTTTEHPDAALISNIFKHLKDKVYDEIPCCVEWSYYDRPVGVKSENLICWELRPYV